MRTGRAAISADLAAFGYRCFLTTEAEIQGRCPLKYINTKLSINLLQF